MTLDQVITIELRSTALRILLSTTVCNVMDRWRWRWTTSCLCRRSPSTGTACSCLTRRGWTAWRASPSTPSLHSTPSLTLSQPSPQVHTGTTVMWLINTLMVSTARRPPVTQFLLCQDGLWWPFTVLFYCPLHCSTAH
jgi:hypothetical protein